MLDFNWGAFWAVLAALLVREYILAFVKMDKESRVSDRLVLYTCGVSALLIYVV
jgi:hypothetical protein